MEEKFDRLAKDPKKFVIIIAIVMRVQKIDRNSNKSRLTAGN